MRRLLLLAAGLVAATACAPTRVPVEVDWTFGGKSCADAGVATIQIDMDGELLDPNRFACDQAGTGVKLGAFLVGPYSVTVTGFDADGNVIYQTTQTIQVRNSRETNVFTIDAAPAEVRWTFASGKTCADVGVDHIYVYFDPPASGSWGKSVADTACAGIGGPVTEMQIVDVPDGQHSFAIQGTRGGQLTYYTHHPVQTLFTAPFTTAVDVTAEGLP